MLVNIITKNSQDTQGGLVTLTAGNEERRIAGVRYGGKLDDNAQYRVYGQFTERDGSLTPDNRDAGDDWNIGKGGFRLDWTPSAQDKVAVQGNYYQGNFDQNLVVPTFVQPYSERQLAKINAEATGGSVQARWEHQYSATSQMGLQVYYQYADREELLYIADTDTTFDLDFRLTSPWTIDEIVWGWLSAQSGSLHRYHPGVVDPNSATTELFSAFVQDQVDLIPEQLRLTAGIKIEHNDYTGWEWQPSIRMLWTVHPDHRLWAAISRNVRTPSRGERTCKRAYMSCRHRRRRQNLPTLVTLFGNDQLEAEELFAYEIGYRGRLAEKISVDATAFYNDYDQVISSVPGTPFVETEVVPPCWWCRSNCRTPRHAPMWI
ncbi:MAG: TonB-dependent receptor [Candidatus Competibacteraceae bacterium]